MQEIDSAKKRAVAQRVDYDDFKNMVSVAHLRPIQAPDLKSKGCTCVFNQLGIPSLTCS